MRKAEKMSVIARPCYTYFYQMVMNGTDREIFNYLLIAKKLMLISAKKSYEIEEVSSGWST